MTAITDLKIAALADRVKNILLKPASEWSKIEGESATLQDIVMLYAAPLAAIPALCGFVGALLNHGSFVHAVGYAVLGYVMSIAIVGIATLVIEFLAPQFGGKADRISALKLAAYSMTPGWVAGVLGLIPPLSALCWLASLYSIYLLYLGVPKLAKIPADKAVTFTAVVVIASAIAGGFFGAILMHT